MKRRIGYLLLFLLCFSFFSSYGAEEPMESVTERGRILEVISGEYGPDSFVKTDLVTLEILTGELKGQVVTIEHAMADSYAYDIVVKPGDKVLLLIDTYFEAGQIRHQIYIAEYVRDIYVYGLGAVFIILLLIIGRKSGFKTLIALLITGVMLLKVLLPGMLKGYSPIPLTMGVATVVTLATLILISGFTKKTCAAFVGVLGGILVAGFITFYIGTKVKITGLSGEEAGMLLFIPQNIDFDFRGLFFSGIMLGSMGAVMDVGMSIASSMEEVRRAQPEISAKRLFFSGMNVGRDIMGTMSNTLILAYTGSSIPLFLVFMAYETDLTKIINLDIIASEIIRALAGTTGLILTIPLTALAASILYSKKRTGQTEETPQTAQAAQEEVIDRGE